MITKYRVGWSKEKIGFLKNYKVRSKEEHSFFLIEFDDTLGGYKDLVDFADRQHFCVTKEAKFTEKELDAAEWFAIDRVWTKLYPYPSDDFGYLDRTYDLTDYCRGNEPKYYCRLGRRQSDFFCVANEPKWATRNIMRLNWIAEELFVSFHCKEKLQEANLKGFAFGPVYIKDKIAADMFQLKIEKQLPKCLKAENFEEVFTCPVCGRSKYLLKSGFIRAEKAPFAQANLDIVKTTEKTGQIGADSLILISKKMYRFLKDEKLSKGMEFVPLTLE